MEKTGKPAIPARPVPQGRLGLPDLPAPVAGLRYRELQEKTEKMAFVDLWVRLVLRDRLGAVAVHGPNLKLTSDLLRCTTPLSL